MSMNISFIITIDPCAIKNGRGSALLKPQNYAATTKGQQAHGHTKKINTATYTLLCPLKYGLRCQIPLTAKINFYGFALFNYDD